VTGEARSLMPHDENYALGQDISQNLLYFGRNEREFKYSFFVSSENGTFASTLSNKI
jgi:hypothetical protein